MKNSEKFWLVILGITIITFAILLWQITLLMMIGIVIGFTLIIFFGGAFYGTLYPWYEFEDEEKIFKFSPLYWLVVGIIKFNSWLDNLK